MKRSVTVFLCALIALSLSACGETHLTSPSPEGKPTEMQTAHPSQPDDAPDDSDLPQLSPDNSLTIDVTTRCDYPDNVFQYAPANITIYNVTQITRDEKGHMAIATQNGKGEFTINSGQIVVAVPDYMWGHILRSGETYTVGQNLSTQALGNFSLKFSDMRGPGGIEDKKIFIV